MSRAFILLTFLFFGKSAFAQKAEQQQLQVDVVYLASNLLEGRETGKRGETLAAQYIASRFEEMGLEGGGEDGSFFHYFDFKYKPNPHSEEGAEPRKGKNVIGYLDNKAPNTVIVGAHYDHLGYGGFGSRHTGEPAIHNGADDNASGVAAMLRLAEQLKDGKANKNNYLFIGFSGEELGLFGSKNFVKNPTINLQSVNYMMNMDMIGRLNEEKVLAVNGVGTSPAWAALDDIKIDMKLVTSESGIGPSDHTSFYLEDIAVLHFFTGQHEDYHKPEDDSELLNYKGIAEISDFILEIIHQLDDDGKIEFTKTKDSSDRKAAAFKVTLGVMPDYVYQGKGMRIDGVMDGRPAQKAGMQKGDIIIKMGDLTVKDIYDYMEGLAKFNEGETGRVAFKRKDKIMVKNVTF